MERLTKKEGVITQIDKDGNITKNNLIEVKDKDEAYKKLCQIEDIEEEFSIDLITLFKAVMNGFWYKNKYGYHQADDYEYVIDLESSRLVKLYEEDGRIFCFEDYGKDWALTKKELEQWHQKND